MADNSLDQPAYLMLANNENLKLSLKQIIDLVCKKMLPVRPLRQNMAKLLFCVSTEVLFHDL